MSSNRWSFSKSTIAVGVFGMAVGMLVGLSVLLSRTPIAGPIVGVVDDWTHHHVVFTNPGTSADALAQGRVRQWYQIVNEPRYQMQKMRRDPLQRALAAAPDFASRMALLSLPTAVGISRAKRPLQVTMKKDWNVNLGPGGTVGAGNSPAKFSFNSPISCSDLAVFNTSVAGSSTQATVMGLTNLYSSSGCGATIPTVAWAYNTTTGDTVGTSVVFSETGNQIAFISSNTSHAYLNVLYFRSGQGTAYDSLGTLGGTTSTGSTYASNRGGASSYLFRAQFGNTLNDVTSSPYYDYSSDTLWVGDASGNVHKFTGVFNGSPGESGNPWATTAATTITSPVYDGAHVYVGGANGIMYSIDASTAVVTHTATIAGGLGITDAPILDVSASKMYVTVGNDGTTQCASSAACAAVWQITTGAFSGGTGNESHLTGVNSTIPLYAGTFDNNHYVNGGTAGNFYGCFSTSSGSFLLNFPLLNFTTSPVGTQSLKVMSTAHACSPLTEVLDGASDYLYLSAGYFGSFVSACATRSCIYNFILGAGSTSALTPAASFQVNGLSTATTSGTSAIIVDYPGTSNYIYFTPNVTGTGSPCTTIANGCAIQVTQSGLI